MVPEETVSTGTGRDDGLPGKPTPKADPHTLLVLREALRRAEGEVPA